MNRKFFFQTTCRKLMKSCFDLIGDHPIFGFLEGLDSESSNKNVKKQRPPGASSIDSEFRKRCTGCDACMAACPVNIIMIEDLTLRHPVIYPEEAPCIHCEGYPCIQSCPTGALDLINGINLRE